MKKEHFLFPNETKTQNQEEEEDETERLSDDDDDEDDYITEHPPLESTNDPELGIVVGLTRESQQHNNNNNDHHHYHHQDDEYDDNENPYGEEASFMVRIPTPGLHNMTDATDHQAGDNDDDDDDDAAKKTTTTTTTSRKEETNTRLVSGLCAICLCNYQVGSDIVWSSNAACEHCFHEHCIERWLIRQRDGPLCPCCRREFVVDPYDLQEDDGDRTPKNHHTRVRHHNIHPQIMSTRRLWLNWTGSLDETVAMDQESLDV